MGGSATWEIYNKLRQLRGQGRRGLAISNHSGADGTPIVEEAPWICVGCATSATRWSSCWDCNAPMVPAPLARGSFAEAPGFWSRLFHRPPAEKTIRGELVNGEPLSDASPDVVACIGRVASATRGFEVTAGERRVRVENGAVLIAVSRGVEVLREGDSVEVVRRAEIALSREGYRANRPVWTGTPAEPILVRRRSK